MKDISINSLNVNLVAPDPDRDAPFALEWFQSEFGRETLLLMGNAENEIKPSTLESEKKIVQEFLELEKTGEQFTWMIRNEDRTLGAVWIEMKVTKHLDAPSIHIMIGDKASRGKGIGRAVLSAMLEFIYHDLKMQQVYSRHLTRNESIARVLHSLGFANDGENYKDANGLIWQNVILVNPEHTQ